MPQDHQRARSCAAPSRSCAARCVRRAVAGSAGSAWAAGRVRRLPQDGRHRAGGVGRSSRLDRPVQQPQDDGQRHDQEDLGRGLDRARRRTRPGSRCRTSRRPWRTATRGPRADSGTATVVPSASADTDCDRVITEILSDAARPVSVGRIASYWTSRRPVCAARKASWSAASPTVRLTARAPWPTEVSRRSTIGAVRRRGVLQGRAQLAAVQRVDPGVGLERREQHRRVRRPLADRVVRRVAEQPAELRRVRRRCRTRRSRCGPGRTARSGPCPAAARCRRRRRRGRAAGSASRRPAGRRWSRP